MPAPLADFYVSPDGSDAWSGKLASPNATGFDGPFATIEAARDAVREFRKSGVSRHLTVLVRGGTYAISRPITFGPEDSNTTYSAYPREKPVISGGRCITGWKTTSDGLWTARIPKSWYFRDLYVNGVRRDRTRVPKEGFFRIAESLGNDVKDAFRYAEDDVKPWDGLEDAEIVVFNSWDITRLRVQSIDEKQRIITFTGSNNWYWGQWGQGSQRYYAENVRQPLEPGQWYLDRATGVLTYRPMPGERIGGVEAIAPRINELLRIQGGDGKPVQRLNLKGLGFQYAGWDIPKEGQVSGQAASRMPGVIVATDLSDARIEDCEISKVGYYGIEIGTGRNVTIKGNVIHDMGSGGIKLHAGDHNAITRNHIYDLGHTWPPAVGIWIGNSGHNTVSYNHIHDLYYTGISVGWSWGYADTATKENVIEHNHIHDLGKGLLSDLGGIYTLGTSTGSVIRYNLIHDSDSFSYGGWGIYLDEGTSGMLVENNIVYRTKTGGFHQHYGKDNIIRNNIFAFGKEDQIQRTRQEAHVSFTFEHNIVYGDKGPLLRGAWDDPKTYKMDYNIYWTVKEANWFEVYKGMGFEKWQSPEREAHTVICDPMFVDPEHGDFRLAPDSRIEKLGFKPIIGAGDGG